MVLKMNDAIDVANRLRPVLVKLSRELRRELRALGVIRERPGIGVRELARLEGMSSPGMTKYVARLERDGLVRRTESSDRRRVGLELTEEAQRVLRSVRSRRTAWLAARLESLSRDELAAVDAAVEPLARLLEARP